MAASGGAAHARGAGRPADMPAREDKAWPGGALRSPSPNSPFLLSAAAERELAAGVARLTASSDGESREQTEARSWTAADSERLYCVRGWGAPYFRVGESGTLCARPLGGEGPEVDLYGLVRSLKAQGLQTPCLFRFPDIVHHRIAQLHACFESAIARYEYQGTYRGVFPVKCNHSRELLASVLEFAQARYGFGLEAGSKAELVLAMAMLARYPGATLVCNGYKDAEYMELLLQCRQLGIEAVVILEQLGELPVLLAAAQKLRVTPVIGVRARLTTRHGGHWGATCGDRAKFGLRPADIVAVVETLRAKGMLGCLQLLHFHAGSQITNIRMVKEAMQEAAFLLAELAQLGAPMAFLDVGGGLGIDYDGSKTDSPASVSYSQQQYANDVVATLQEVCTQRRIPVPTILSESGRALASHSAVMVFDVLTKEADAGPPASLGSAGEVAPATTKGRFLLMTAAEALQSLQEEAPPTAASLNEAYADAAFFKEEALRAFKLGVLALRERAEIDRLFEAVCARIFCLAEAHTLPLPQPLAPETRPHSRIFHVNLSVFRSAVDSWALGQLFPILPLHRLSEEPRESCTLADITCDSDGKIDRFVSPDGGQPAPVLPLHSPRAGEEYLLGLFLGGVYQEVMGSAHNMLGQTHAVQVTAAPGCRAALPPGACSGPGAVSAAPDGRLVGDGFVVDSVVRGESIEEVLARANHHGPAMCEEVRRAAAAAVELRRLDPALASGIAASFARRLNAYTYLT